MFELVLRAPLPLVETLCDELIDELHAASVSVEDADAGSDAEQALFGEPGMPAEHAAWPRSSLRALFAERALADAATESLTARHGAGVLPAGRVQELPDQDWVRLTQSQFAPIEITAGFWVVPSWHAVPGAATTVIRLDPGLAFGTGTHPTTRMCLGWLARQPALLSAAHARVLDYGCGSGILAIGAALFGARNVDAVDIDPAAVVASVANAHDNGVLLNCGAPDLAVGEYGVVLANILATPLRLLAPVLVAHVAPGGQLVLAGILERQADELCAAYAPWLPLQVSDRQDGWVLMTGNKAHAAQVAR
jgi:ribosomal protein L11 methyltransferase